MCAQAGIPDRIECDDSALSDPRRQIFGPHRCTAGPAGHEEDWCSGVVGAVPHEGMDNAVVRLHLACDVWCRQTGEDVVRVSSADEFAESCQRARRSLVEIAARAEALARKATCPAPSRS